MAIQLTPVLEQSLQRLAAMTNQTVDEVAQEAVEAYLKKIEILTAAVNEAEATADRDGWLTHEEVFERLDKRLMKSA